MTGSLPSSGEGWMNALSLSAGVVLGWLVSPVVWFVAGPFRLLAMMLGQASQESGYNATICGDSGSSCGILQFQSATIESLGGDDDDRLSPFWSGFYGVKMIQTALLYNLGWWRIAIPVYGYAVLRLLWTHGWATGDIGEKAWSRKGWGASYNGVQEDRAWYAFMIWRAITLLPVGLMIWTIKRAAKKAKGKR